MWSTGGKKDPSKPLMKTRSFHKGSFTKMPSSSSCKPGWRLQQFHDDSRQRLLTDVLQTWVGFSFFMGLAHSYPERICQIRIILTLNFWLSSEKAHVHQCGCDSGGHSSRGSGVNPQPGREQVLQPAWLLQSGFTRGSGNNFKQLRWKCFIVIHLPPSHAKSHLMPFILLSPALMALSSCFTSWTLWHNHCPNSRLEAEFLFLI